MSSFWFESFPPRKEQQALDKKFQRFQATCKHESSCWMGKCPTSTPSHSTLDAQAFVWHEEWKAWHEKLSSREGYALLGDCLSDFCLPDSVPLFVWLIPGGEAKTLPSTDTIFPKLYRGFTGRLGLGLYRGSGFKVQLSFPHILQPYLINVLIFSLFKLLHIPFLLRCVQPSLDT